MDQSYYLPLLVLFLILIFRNPEFGHEFDTNSVEGCVASSGSRAVTAATVGPGFCHRTRMIIRDTPPARSATRPGGKVAGDPNSTNSPKTRTHTGMTAVRLNSIDIVVLLSCGARKTRRVSRARLAQVTLCRYLDLDLLGLGVLAQWQADGQHSGLVFGVHLASVDCWR